MYTRRTIADITSGLTVSFAAISLGAAFGVLSGRGAFAGMISAAVIPIITSLFGGTRIQASGPTAPMSSVSALVVAFAYDRFPVHDLAEQFITLIFILNALFLIAAGFLNLGRFVRMVPNIVIYGFMNGIAILIWIDQLGRIFGWFDSPPMKGGLVLNGVIALGTLGLIYLISWLVNVLSVRQPLRSFLSGVLWSIILITGVTAILHLSMERTTLGNMPASFTEFGSLILRYLPSAEVLTPENLTLAGTYAAELTLLAYLDSLLTALVIDRITGEHSKLNKELVAQGFANGAAGMLQGIPGAQATIRSVLLVKEGAKTRLAGVLIGVFALLTILLLKDLLTLVPSAVFTGVLMKAGIDVAEWKFVKSYFQNRWLQIKQRNIHLGFIVYTTIVTVVWNLNVAVVSATVLFYLLKMILPFEDDHPVVDS